MNKIILQGLKKMEENYISLSPKKKNIVFIVLFALFILLIYRSYILGQRYFLSTDMSMDSYDQTYPFLLSTARDISSFELSSHMDFTRGLGVIVNYMLPKIENFAAYFGESNVPIMMNVILVIKIYLSGVFFFLYLRIREKSVFTSSSIALFFAFCGHMIYRQYWIFYPNEIMLVSMWLMCFELYYIKNNKMWLPLASFIFFYNCSSLYYVILYFALLSVYIFYRFNCDKEKVNKTYKEFCKVIAFLLGMLVLSTGVSTLYDNFINTITSNRFETSLDDYSTSSTSVFISKEALKAGIFRTFGININGIKKDYIGSIDYLNDLTLYCGIFILLYTPISLSKTRGKERIWYSLGLALAILYLFFNPIRVVANGFSGDTFKLSSFWIILLILLINSEGLEYLFCLKNKKEFSIYFIISLLVSFVLLRLYIPNSQILNSSSFAITMIYILLYVTLLLCYMKNANEILFKLGLLFFFFSEAYMMSYTSIDMMDNMYEERLESKTLYNDDTVESLAFLKSKDQSFFRIDKQYFSYRYNDPIAQNYFGTSYYFGGIGVGNKIIEFYDSLKLPTADSSYKYAHGTSVSTELNTILGVKYILSRNPNIINYGYELIDNRNDIYVFENKYSIPIGVVYENCITKTDFDVLNNNEKQKLIMNTCVLEDGNNEVGVADKSINVENIIQSFDDKYRINYIKNSSLLEFENTDNSSVIVLKIKFKGDESEYRANLKYITETGLENNYTIRLDPNDERTIELNGSDIKSLSFTSHDGTSIPIDVLSCYSIPKEIYYEKYIENISELNKNGIILEEFSGNIMKGTINSEKDGVLYLSIPYSNWRIYIDGEEVDVFPVNIAFTGCKITAGNHDIEILLKDDVGILEKVVQFITLLLCILYLFYKSGKKKLSMKRGTKSKLLNLLRINSVKKYKFSIKN